MVANLAGLIAGAATALAIAFLCSIALEGAGVATLPKWLLYGIVGISLSFGVTAFQYGRKFASGRPRLRYEFGKLMLFLVGAGVVFGATAFYSKWKSDSAKANLHGALLEAQARLTQQLPKALDDVTTLTSVNVEDTKWTYVYSLSTNSFDRQELRRRVRQNFCASDLKEWLAKGVSYNFEYRDKSGTLLTQFQVTSCP